VIAFENVNRAALAALPAVLTRLIPGGKILGHEYVVLNPRRNDRRPGSFKINVRNGRWADFATGDGGDPVSLVAYVENCSQSDAAIWLAQMLGLPPFMPGRGEHARPVLCSPQRSPQTQQIGRAIWAEAVSPYSTLVDRYLRSRCLDLPPWAADEAIRFHPDCPFGSERFPAMVCLVRNILSNEPQAVHRESQIDSDQSHPPLERWIASPGGPLVARSIYNDPSSRHCQVVAGLAVRDFSRNH
jgi:hypothetical protein